MTRTLTAVATGLLLLAGSTPALWAGDSQGAIGPEAAFPAAWSDAGQPDAKDAPDAIYGFYYVLGVQLQPRVSATTFAYDFNGCIHLTGGTDNRLTFPLLVPDGSLIKFVRIYYDDTNAGVDLTTWLSTYQAGVTSTDLLSLTSTGSAGYGTVLSPELFIDFDGTINYSLIVAPNVNNSTVQICGVRVAYYAP